jgi:probable HAF family extracellular repeat protein
LQSFGIQLGKRRIFMKKILTLTLLIAGALAQAQVGKNPAGSSYFFTIDYPMAGVTDTEATAINASGEIVGRYFTPDGHQHGFTLINGQYQSIDVPGAVSVTDAAWLNDRGDIVGGYNTATVGPAYVLSAGVYITIEYPGASVTTGWGISDGGDVVGTEFNDNFLAAHGYLFRYGYFSTIDVPNAQATWPTGVLDPTTIVGTYYGPDSVDRGFLFYQGKFRTINFPNSTFTWITGINSLGHIVGFYNLSDGIQHGFVWKNGRYITIDVPGATGTEANGIGSQDDVVGRYYTADGHTHGYFLSHVR